ncbi:glycosyltransferase family 4 protein [Rugosimonospora africana]|uniref:Glycogen synthase n=1 Tax=Rugosimonospora africana TaxID=556532 RepID=A0A8J3R102_9ACTN|nr:glycosyltransferase family 4 protein [Rugosimonospora africana]GIH19637.1 glycogen synthase [Rugosimonospora africana]
MTGRAMHLGLMTPEWYQDEPAGGIATYCRVLAAAAVRFGHRVTVYAATTAAGRRPLERGRLRVLPVAAQSGQALEWAERFRAVWLATAPADRPEVLEAADFGGVAALLLGDAGSVPVTTRLHLPLASLLRRNDGQRIYRDDSCRLDLERRQAEGSALLTSPTRWLSAEATAVWGLTDPPAVIPNPVSPGCLAPAHRAAGGREGGGRQGGGRESGGCESGGCESSGLPRVLYFGRLEHRKGVLALAEAVATHLRRGGPATVTFAGRDTRWRGRSLREQMEERLSGIPDPDRCRFRPPLRWPALRREIDHSDLVVLPSRYENFPYACLEAMARGRTVLACSGSGVDEIIASGTTGHLVAPDDPDALAGALDRLLCDPAALTRTGARARAAVARFAPHRVVPPLLARYGGLAAE